MPMRNSLLPREGLTADPVIRLIRKTFFNPIFTLPLLLLARYTEKGQLFARGHTTILSRVKVLCYLGLYGWVTSFLDNGALNNWKSDKYDWEKEIVVITGGSDGIGKIVVQLLAERGIKVAVLDVQPLTYDAPPGVQYYHCDITSVKNVAAAAAEIRASLGKPTILINNAGIAGGKATVLGGSEKDIRTTFEINSLAHYWTVKEFLPDMVSKNHGTVVTVASLASYITSPNMVSYASTKAAAMSFHEGLGAELATRYDAPRVRTVVVTPGYTQTKLLKGWSNDSTFLFPTMEPETVAEAVVKKVLTGTSGYVVVPGFASFFAGFRMFSMWYQTFVRKDAQKALRKPAAKAGF